MKPRIKTIATQQGEPLESVQIESGANFNQVVRLLIGPSGGEGEEIFDIYISSPAWIEQQCKQRGYWLARRTLVLPYWNPSLVRSVINEVVLTISGQSWQDISQQLASFMMWEFQEYKE